MPREKFARRGYVVIMKTHNFGFRWIAAVAALGGAALLAAANPRPAPPAPAANGSAVTLDKGMTEAQIVELIGQPDRVEPLKMPGGKAEEWIYRQMVGQTTTQEAASMAWEEAFIGTGGPGNNGLGGRPALRYSTKHVATYRVTALMMVNGALALARQWDEQKVSYGP